MTGRRDRRASAGRPNNVLILIADDLRFDGLSVAGNRLIRTPNLDRLAEHGVFFRSAFVTTAVCATSRASIMLGQYASRHGNWDFETPLTKEQWGRSYHGVLRQAGYRVGYIGKWGLGGDVPYDRFDFFDGFAHRGDYFSPAGGGRHLTDRQADLAVRFLTDQARSNRPYCLTVGFWAPHAQPGDPDSVPADRRHATLYADIEFPRPQTFADYLAGWPGTLREAHSAQIYAEQLGSPERFQAFVHGYHRLIFGMDQAVGRILEAASNIDALASTLVLFLSDNGYFLGEHGFSGKWLIHEESIQIPLIARFPDRGSPAPRGLVSRIVLNIDVAPTVLTAAGISADWANGAPLQEIWDSRWRQYFFYEYRQPPFRCVGIRTETHKFAIMPEHGLELAYDLTADPLERRNLASAPEAKSVFDKLRREVLDRYAGSPLLSRR